MADESKEAAKAKKGMHVIGICNGTRTFMTKNGQQMNVLVVIPNVGGVVEVKIDMERDDFTKYLPGSEIHMLVKPTFYNGRVSGFEKM